MLKTLSDTGAGANFSGTSARDNTLFGHNTDDITSGDYNTCYGSSMGNYQLDTVILAWIRYVGKGVNTSVHSNVMIGRDAGKELLANKNVAIGNEAFYSTLLRLNVSLLDMSAVQI